MAATHEDLSRQDEVKVGSERSFGIVFAVVFALIGAVLSYRRGHLVPIPFGISAAFAAIAMLIPSILKPLNKLWFLFGMLLHKIVSPIVLAILFYGILLPTGVLMRIVGSRPLSLKFDPNMPSYWVERKPPGPPPETMQHQF